MPYRLWEYHGGDKMGIEMVERLVREVLCKRGSWVVMV
jgi:hypothetical protein